MLSSQRHTCRCQSDHLGEEECAPWEPQGISVQEYQKDINKRLGFASDDSARV